MIAHAHHRDKSQGEMQDMGMTWARAGCLVLVIDQVGYGQRRSSARGVLGVESPRHPAGCAFRCYADWRQRHFLTANRPAISSSVSVSWPAQVSSSKAVPLGVTQTRCVPMRKTSFSSGCFSSSRK